MPKNKPIITDLRNVDDEDTDSEDDDYVPDGKVSEESNQTAGENDDDDNDAEESSGKKLKKRKVDSLDDSIIEEKKLKSTKNIDEIWSGFLNDVNKIDANKQQQQKNDKYTQETTQKKPETVVKNNQVQVHEGLNIINVKATPKPSGIAGLLDKINKKPKISTLEKSRQDWDQFKKSEKIDDELASQTKSKGSYLERKAFLDRTDMRQFEIEKDLRTKERQTRNTPNNS